MDNTEQQKYYKVLKDGTSYNGGNMQYSLPRKRGKGWQPGAWHEVSGKIVVCRNGLHLTTEPYRWYEWGALIYEAQGEGDCDVEGDKIAFRRVRLLQPVPAPKWITDTQEFISKLPSVNWLKPDGQPKSEWKLFPNRSAARAAAGAAARDAARAAAGAAARDAALYTRVEFICADLELEEKHRQHAHARWEVWTKGYGLLCDIDGQLYVYQKVI